MRITKKHPKKLTKMEYVQISRLHNRYGMMWEEFKEYSSNQRSRVILAKKGPVVLGWASIFHTGEEYHLHVYVGRRFRKKGIGTSLIRFINRSFRSPMHVFPWNEAGDRLFDHLKL